MAVDEVALLGVLIFAAAVLYSSVGNAGASGYLAMMAFVGVAPEVMKPTALVLNVLVSVIASAWFYRAGCLTWRELWPFVLGSVPLAVVGGALDLPPAVYKPVVGVVLLVAAARLVQAAPRQEARSHAIPHGRAVFAGGAIGLLSGLTGIGGGIFLGPLLLLTGWADARRAAGLSAAFVLATSVAGLAGSAASLRSLPGAILVWAPAAVAGGLIGAGLGSRKLAVTTLRRLLAVVLAIAGLKLILP